MKKAKALLALLLALVMALALMTSALADEAETGDETTPPAQTEFKFTDVADDNAFAKYIYDIYEREITKGTSETTFGPAENMTRAQFVTFVGRLSGADVSGYTDCPFTDVTDIFSWAKGYICWAFELGITTGTSETTFAPGDKVTREQMATFMLRFADAYEVKLTFSEKTAADIDSVSSWATKAVKAFGGVSIDLDANGKFNPTVPATREQMAKVLSMFPVPEGGFVLPEPKPPVEGGNVITVNGKDYELKAGDKDTITLKNSYGFDKVYAGKLFTKVFTDEIADNAVVNFTCADGYKLDPITGDQLKKAVIVFYVDKEAVADEYEGVSYIFRFAYPPADGSDNGVAAKFVTGIEITAGADEKPTAGSSIKINGKDYALETGEDTITLTNKKGVAVKYDGKDFTKIYTETIADDAVVTITCADDYTSTITGGQLKVAMFAFTADGEAVADEYDGVTYAFRFAFPAEDGALTGSPSKFVTEIKIA